MKQTIWKRWAMGGVLAALLLGGCGGGEEATPTQAATASATPTAAATSTAVPTKAPSAAQQDSPLAAPDSPLQPASPLPADASTGTGSEAAGQTAGQAAAQPAGPSIDIAVPSDINVITQLAQETKAPAPKEGMAAVSGVLYAPTVNRIIPGTKFYLTPAIEDNGELLIPSLFGEPKPENGDIAGFSNEKGQMLLDNVPPGNYYLAVWAIYNWPLAFGGATDERPLLITVAAGEQRDLGLLYVPEWP